jgi:glycosyltransferase involved in cell wall biosynthesis
MTRLLVWTENYWVGGSDRFLADVLPGLTERYDVRLAGNPLPEFDAWLADRVPDLLPRTTVPIANLVASPVARLRDRVAPSKPALAAEAEQSAPRANPLTVASALLRYRAAAVNLVRLRRLLRREQPDAILVNNGGYPGGESCRILTLAAAAEGIGAVVHFVHNMAYPPWWPAGLERRLDRRVDAATARWVTAAHRASDALAAQRGFARSQIATVHYGIPDPPPPPGGFDRDALRAELGFGRDALGVVMVAAFEPRKGHAVLLEALTATPPEVRVALVGRGPEERAMRDLATSLGVAGRVRFAGWRDDVDDVLRASDALVLPSLGNECLPYAILEAMAHGLPVVGTDVAGIPEEIENGVTGTVVPPGDAAALASAMAGLAANRDLARRQGEAGRERRRRLFGVERMVEQVAGLVDDARAEAG